MADERLIGRDYLTPDLFAKVTGRAKYAEDYRADGMLFCKLLLSPMPHARVRRIDAAAALAMPGVKAILTADDLPDAARGDIPALTNEPLYEGEPILAVAAVDELTAAQAIERIDLDLELLPFVTDPLESLRPNSPNATTTGNVLAPSRGPARRDIEGAVSTQTELRTLKWTDDDFAAAGEGQLPMGEAPEEWSFGDVDAGLKEAALLVDETFVVQATSHQTLETRSALAYWQNGRLFLHGSTQSTMRTHALVANWVGVDPSDVVFVSEYTGGGFGAKGGGAVSMCIPALLAKKANAPVMMRISREDEHYIGHARTNMTGRARVGFRRDGRITALDLFIVQDNGARGERGDHRAAGMATSLLYQPLAMRWRAVNVLTNTPTRLFQRSPGEMQGIAIVEQAVTKAAQQLGIDQVEMRTINAPAGKAPFGPERIDDRADVGHAEVIDERRLAGLQVDLDLRKAGDERVGRAVARVGVLRHAHQPDACQRRSRGLRRRVDVLGQFVSIVASAEGDGASRRLRIGQAAPGAAAPEHPLAAKLVFVRTAAEIAGGDLLELPSCVHGARVVRARHRVRGLAAHREAGVGKRAIGAAPHDLHPVPRHGQQFCRDTCEIEHGVRTQIADTALHVQPAVGTDGHQAVVSDRPRRVRADRDTHAADLVADAPAGPGGALLPPESLRALLEGLLHERARRVPAPAIPRSMVAQVGGGSCLGIGHALTQKWVYDPHYGVPLAKRFHYNKPLTILDVPRSMRADAVGLPDPGTPVGARGVGEPPVGAAYGAVLNAIASAVGVDAFRRAPVTADVVLMTLEHGRRMHAPLQAHL